MRQMDDLRHLVFNMQTSSLFGVSFAGKLVDKSGNVIFNDIYVFDEFGNLWCKYDTGDLLMILSSTRGRTLTGIMKWVKSHQELNNRLYFDKNKTFGNEVYEVEFKNE